MRSQEQAFRAYYAAMTDAELLEIAAHETSFIAIAQKILEEEMGKRGLTPARPQVPARRSFWGNCGDHLAKWTGRLHHHAASP